MIAINCDGVRELLELMNSADSKESPNILIIDCRSFFAHNDSHIINSINVFYPPFLRRRGKPSLEVIISDAEIRDRLMMADIYSVVLYDEKDLTKESFGMYVATCLEDAGIKCVSHLEGGFTAFKKQYPTLCTNNLQQNPPQVFNKAKRSSGQYIYTWPFKSKASLPHKPLALRNDPNVTATFGVEDSEEPAELLPYLFLGSETHAASKSTLLKLGITAVLNVSHNCPNYFEDSFAYKRIAIKDSKLDDITMVINEALDYIGKIFPPALVITNRAIYCY
ncbi:PREDICTED: dual specificity protein phosphatase 1-like [Rhagoletis zephyria]|uniref:dual specificity protein phosphatase 1-like n=1 Tax=Rhagoletis zephyria TaxID=28612 RepID=UPI000811952E|nr:PREDICTED: dual specificity protein phosphatase 1-like [Rhagoletis zephyria]